MVSRPPIRRLIDVVPVCFLLTSAASYPTLPVHRSDSTMISMLKVQSERAKERERERETEKLFLRFKYSPMQGPSRL